MNKLSILVVDDQEAMRESMAAWLEKSGYKTSKAENGAAALDFLEREHCDLVLLDIKMPGMDGHELLKQIRHGHPETIIVMITAYGSIESAIECMKAGASDYLRKPFNPRDLLLLIEKLTEKKEISDEYRLVRDRLAAYENKRFGDLLGCSRVMQSLFKQIEEVARADVPVLITGETGTGKELVARAIHSRSSRAPGPFVAINCGAIPEQLLESELFGHERGAFTDAVKVRVGRLEMADQGTLFLDEVGEVSSQMQVGLLRALEEKSFLRVGGSKEVESDFRLICATHRDMNDLLTAGRIRRDFFYRISVMPMQVPPLRERGDDIILLARHFLQGFSREISKPIEDFTPAAYRLLNRYNWPGNVRELMNVIERAVIMGSGPQIEARDLSFLGSEQMAPIAGASLEEIEAKHIRQTLEDCGWNISRTAEVLKIDRGTLSRHMKKHGIVKPR